MGKFMILTRSRVTGAEAYWTGKMDRVGTPLVTENLASALGFETARAAYDKAGLRRVLQTFRVGRRPVPVDLRA